MNLNSIEVRILGFTKFPVFANAVYRALFGFGSGKRF
jgi:hypothetical protein